MAYRGGRTCSGYEPHIYAMHRSMDLRETLREEREELETKVTFVQSFLRWLRWNMYRDALETLRNYDPDWRAWFDDDSNVPAVIYWSNYDEVKGICDRMYQRAAEVFALSLSVTGPDLS